MQPKRAGSLMRAEINEIPERFAAALLRDLDVPNAFTLKDQRAIYTLARGSSDAAATVLSYEIMRLTGIPSTSLPPSVFSLCSGIRVEGCLAIAISQSGKSPDLVRAATGFRVGKGLVLVLTNTVGSPLADASDAVLDLLAGPERATPATKSVVCSIATGMAMMGHSLSDYARQFDAAVSSVADALSAGHDSALVDALSVGNSVYVIGRGCGFGVAQEIALKLKECCALHAEAFSASEVLHGPLQLAARALTVLIIDTGEDATKASLLAAEQRFSSYGARVIRMANGAAVSPAAASAVLLTRLYPVVLATALALGLDPDTPHTLSKVTETM